MSFGAEGLIYLIAGVIIIFLYTTREKGLNQLNHNLLPEFDKESFNNLKILLRISYKRTLYLGIAFLFLAYITFSNLPFDVKALAIVVTVMLFLYNIPPRNKVMKIFMALGMDLKEIKKRGIKL